MIRRDYILRLITEMTQVLLRVVSLRHRQEYEQALKEVDVALRQLNVEHPDRQETMGVEEWIELCQKHEAAASGLMLAVGQLLREQGELFALRQQPKECRRARTLALGILIETLLTGRTFVSEELLDSVERLFLQTQDEPLPAAVLKRLLRYFEARAHYAKAEDILYLWRESGNPEVGAEGTRFYDRLLSLRDEELERGNLPRAEVVLGRAGWSNG